MAQWVAHMPLGLYAIAFLLALALSAAITAVMKRLAPALGAVAQPSNDRWHRRPVPLLGGVGIYIGCLGAILIVGMPDVRVGWTLGAGSVMALVGVLDDFIQVRPSSKLMAQVLVACAVLLGMGSTPWLGSPVLDALITIFWVVAITNAFNLLDNMDGLCAGIAAIAALAFTVIVARTDPALGALGAALAGAACGFLIFNFHPASIFMGDTGSLFIGATLAVVSLSVEHRDTMGVVSTLAFPVLLMLIPLFDTAFVTLSRKLSARKASVGGRDHTSHRLVAMGYPESRAVLLLYAFAVLGGATAITLSRASLEEASVLTGVLVIGLMLLGVRLARVNVYGGADFALLKDKPYTPLLVDFTYKRRVFELLLDLLLASLAYYAAYVVRFADDFPVYANLFIQSFPTVIGCELAGLYLAGAYRGIWRYVSVSDLGTYLKGIAFGSLGSVLSLVYLSRFEGYSRGVFVINAVFLAVLVLGSRVSFRALGELSHRYRMTGRPALIYGAGDGGALAVRELRTNPRFDFRAVGFIDDDPSKQGRRVAGLTVLGTFRDLVRLLGTTGAEVVILTTTLEEPRQEALQATCFEAGVQILKLQVTLDLLDRELARVVAGGIATPPIP